MVTAGARAVGTDSRARLIISLVSAQTFVAGTLLVFLPVLAIELLHWGEGGLGAVNAAIGIGGIVGAAASVAFVGARRLARPLAIGTLLWGAPIALAAAWDTKAGALVLFGIVGLANTIVDVSAYTMLQRAVPDRVLARVFGVLESVIYATHAIGGVVAAVLIEAFGLRAALVAVGAFLPVIVMLTWPRLRRLDASADVPERALELLHEVPFLAVLPAGALEALAERAVPVTVAAGEAVFRQGEPGDRFYVIGEGTVGVAADGEERPSLGRGQYFGEIALLRDVPRTATVTARTDLDLLAVERDDFIAAVTGPRAERRGCRRCRGRTPGGERARSGRCVTSSEQPVQGFEELRGCLAAVALEPAEADGEAGERDQVGVLADHGFLNPARVLEHAEGECRLIGETFEQLQLLQRRTRAIVRIEHLEHAERVVPGQ